MKSYEWDDENPYFEWDEEYSVRNKFIDNQHKNILIAINTLIDAINNEQPEKLCSKLHRALIAYAERHFSHEEALLEKHNFSNLEKHKKSHQYFVQKVNEIYQAHKKQQEESTVYYHKQDKDLEIAPKMLEFLKLWFLKHILKIDKEYTYFLYVRGEE